MQFNSISFLVFFAVVLALHHLPTPWTWRKLQLILASYLFYAAWNPPLVVLVWISTVLDWTIAKRLGREGTSRHRRRMLVSVSLAGNLGLLGAFKYGDFLISNFNSFTESLGLSIELAEPDLVLPVGISFYTFQTLSYTLDVYRGKMRPWTSFVDYALYVTFFPQLVAGPIVRAGQFLEQCGTPRRAKGEQFSWGLMLVTVGLFEKVVVADGLLAGVVEMVYDGAGVPSAADGWLGTAAFAVQIFCDFAGYSTCAIGVALMLGFVLPMNFRFPYAAVGFSDFWRRWHISLSTWLRDYLYISLGGNRLGRYRTLRNLMITMLLGGLWHGASWTFVAWGGLHGLYLVAEQILAPLGARYAMLRTRAARFVLGMATFALVCVTWVFFRADTFGRAFEMLGGMFGARDADMPIVIPMVWRIEIWAIIGSVLLVHWLMRDRSLEETAKRCPWPLRSLVLAVMLIAIVISPGEDRAFIYFQF